MREVLGFAAFLLGSATAQNGNTSITGLSDGNAAFPLWCGKPYMSGSPNVLPEGKLVPPDLSPMPKLLVQVQPRHSIYDSSERTANLILDAVVSYTASSTIDDYAVFEQNEMPLGSLMMFEVRIEETDQFLASGIVPINSRGNLVELDLAEIDPRLTPYRLILRGLTTSQTYYARTDLYYLPAKNSGSTVKIDNLYGGMLVANNVTNYTFEPFLPFGFYTSCSDYLNHSLANVLEYKDMGFNAINPVCAFTDGDLTYLFDWLDEVDLWYQYDMRHSYLNLTQVSEQVPLIKDRSAFLSWYTADEPDGWVDDLNSTKLAYDLLKQLDPYHPTGLVLNCENYFFGPYSSGADYVMEDVYPIGINVTYSRVWNTTCNETYGDCGCDNCLGELRDVSDRLDTYANYQEWLGQFPSPLWTVLQAFGGTEYWSRDPTAEETWAMMVLSFNHRSKATMSWLFPTSNVLSNAHAAFAKVVTVNPISAFLLGADPLPVEVSEHGLLDVSYWVVGSQMMIGFANLDRVDSNGTVSVELPVRVNRIASQPWGSTSWSLGAPSNSGLTVLSVEGLDALATDLLILDIGPQDTSSQTTIDDYRTTQQQEQNSYTPYSSPHPSDTSERPPKAPTQRFWHRIF